MKVEDRQVMIQSFDILLNYYRFTCIICLEIVFIYVIDLDHSTVFKRTVCYICYLKDVSALFVRGYVACVEEITKWVFGCFEASYWIASLINEIKIIAEIRIYTQSGLCWP